MTHINKFCMKPYIVNQFTPLHLTLGGIDRLNLGYRVFIGLCVIDNVLSLSIAFLAI